MAPREGAFAQYLKMPMSNLVEVPSNVPLAKAALAEPLAVSWHAARLAFENLHNSMDCHALVIGGGAIGLAAALALPVMGADSVTIIEPNAARRAFLRDRCGQNAVETTDVGPSLMKRPLSISSTKQTRLISGWPLTSVTLKFIETRHLRGY